MITLINHQGLKVNKGIQLQSPSPSIGLAYIGAYLKKHGHDYTAIDACGEAMDQIVQHHEFPDIMIQGLTHEEVLERIPSDTKIVGFTCLFSFAWPLVIELAAKVREAHPDVILVLGGEHGTAMAEESIRMSEFDLIVLGEGEETFLDLVHRGLDRSLWRTIPGICYVSQERHFIKTESRKRTKTVDDFPYPDWDAWSIEEYISRAQVTGINLGRMIPVLGSRGCPYACKFCSNENMWTRRYIMRDPVGLADELAFMKEKYKVEGFTFMDSTFVVNRRKTLAFAQELIQREMNIHYQLPAGTRCEAFDDELVKALDESGLKNFAFAPESGSKEILETIGKQIDIDRFLQAGKSVLNSNMTTGCFIVIGFPEDTPSTLKETLGLVRKVALLGIHDITISKYTPYPGSIYYDELKEEGKIPDDMTQIKQVINFYSAEGISYCHSMSAAKLFQWMIWMYLNFYVLSFLCRPWRVVASFYAYFTKGVEQTKYVRLFNELFRRRRHWKQLNVTNQ